MAECHNTSIGNITKPSEDTSPEAELERQIHFFFMELGVPLVCAFGLVGNVLNLMVLTREKIQCSLTKMEKSAHIGLIALAVSDFMFCLLALLFTLLPNRRSYYTQPSGVMYYHWLGGSFITLFIVTSTWLIVVMAGERYLAVCHPFKARKFISLRKTKITVLAVFLVCIVSTVPLFLEREIRETKCVNNHTTIFEIKIREEYGKYGVSIRRLVWAIFFDFIPCVALLYFNACLVWKIHTAKKLRREMAPGYKREGLIYRSPTNDHSRTTYRTDDDTIAYCQLPLKNSASARIKKNSYPHEGNSTKRRHVTQTTSLLSLKTKKRQSDNALNNVTATLVAVVVLFLILVSPSEVVKFIYSQIQGQSPVGEHYKKIILHVTNFMQSLNFSVNFVLYCAVNKTFRSTLSSIFCYCTRSNTPLPPPRQMPCTHVQELT